MRLFSILLVIASVHPITAHASPVSSQALLKCTKITQNEDRLHCFDAVASQLQVAPEAVDSTKPQAAQSTRSVVKPAPVAQENTPLSSGPTAQFGLEQKQVQQAADEISAMITKVDKGPRDKLIIALDNNMVWKQKDSAYLRARKNMTASVEKGALGVFYLKVEGSNRRIKVERVR